MCAYRQCTGVHLVLISVACGFIIIVRRTSPTMAKVISQMLSTTYIVERVLKDLALKSR